ncbi:MAG TPA: PAS domain S-box protein [Gemmataceae bacterium]|nr:PAS domain S-box protein [Gemmataceae bacterium]
MRDPVPPPHDFDPASPVRILLVGNRPDNLSAIQDALAANANHIQTVGSQDEALARLMADEFAVVVLDAGPDAIDTARRIRRHPRAGRTPILFVTGAGESLPTAEAYRLGLADVLTRPIDADALRAKVGIFVEFSRQTQRVARLQESGFDRRLAEAVQVRMARQAALRAEVAQALANGRAAVPAVLQKCAEAMVRHLDAAFARVWTLNEADRVLELQASAGMYTHLDGPHSRVPVGALKVGRIAEERHPHLTNDVPDDPRVSDPDWARREGMVAFAGYPLLAGDRLLGVAALFARQRLAPDTLETLGAAADAIAQGLERRRSETELGESERRFARFMQHLPGLAWIKDAHGRYVYANDAAERAFGTPRSALYGKTDDEVFPPETAAHFRDHDRRALATAAGVQVVETLTHPDGSLHYSLVSKFPIPGTGGRSPLVGGIAIDVTDRMRAERDAQLRARLLDTVGQAVVVTDPVGRIVYWNRYAETLYGWSRDEALGRDVADLLAAPGAAREGAAIMDRLREGKSWSGEFPVRRKDGTTFPAFVTDTPVFDDRGRLTGIIGISADITEQKRVEQGLRLLADASAALAALTDYESTLQSVAGLAVPEFADFCVVDMAEKDGTFRRVAVAHADPARAEVIRHLARRYPPGRDPQQGVVRALATGEPELLVHVPDAVLVQAAWDEEHLQILRGLSLTSLMFVPLRDRGRPIGVITFATADSGRRYGAADLAFAEELARRAAIALENARLFARASDLRAGAEAARERLAFLADASVALAGSLDPNETLDRVAQLAVPRLADWCVVDIADPDGIIRQAAVAHPDRAAVQLAWELDRRYPDNPAAPVGVPKVVRTGRPEFFPEISDAILAAVARDEEHLRAVRRLGLRSGMIVPLAARGRVVGAVSLGTAESGRTYTADDLALAEEFARRAAVALDNARLHQALKEADRRKDEFLATLAHELRNPLAPIRTGLEVMRMAGGDRAASGRAREVMERQLGQMVRLIDDLLDVSRITRGKLTLRREPVELEAVISNAIETSRPAIEAEGHALVVDLPPRPVKLDADPARLAQVFANLLNNAAKFTPPGGRIWLSGVVEADTRVVVRVRDSGIGIAAEALPRLFEMFAQVDRGLDRTQAGLGIGLALVKGLVEMHGGIVEAHSAGRGHGSEFIVRLPLAPTDEIEPLTESPPGMGATQSASDSPRRVLVVDDNRDAADSLSDLVGMLGHEVRTVHDGLAAIAVARAFRPQVVLMDIGMPKLNGYEAARHIRAEPWGRDVVLAAVTGWGQEADRQRSREAGFDHHLVKPVEPAAVRQVLADPRLARR